MNFILTLMYVYLISNLDCDHRFTTDYSNGRFCYTEEEPRVRVNGDLKHKRDTLYVYITSPSLV